MPGPSRIWWLPTTTIRRQKSDGERYLFSDYCPVNWCESANHNIQVDSQKNGIQGYWEFFWIPASAGMTEKRAFWRYIGPWGDNLTPVRLDHTNVNIDCTCLTK